VLVCVGVCLLLMVCYPRLECVSVSCCGLLCVRVLFSVGMFRYVFVCVDVWLVCVGVC